MNAKRFFVALSVAALFVTVAIPAAAHTPEEWLEEVPHTGLTRELLLSRPLALQASDAAPVVFHPDRGAGRLFTATWNNDGVEFWRPLVSQYFTPAHTEWAMRVMKCESGGDPNAKNPNSSASGLFQHLARYWTQRSADAGLPGADIFDPEANIAVAAWLYNGGSGASHWVCK